MNGMTNGSKWLASDLTTEWVGGKAETDIAVILQRHALNT
jgi:hypothetical protein